MIFLEVEKMRIDVKEELCSSRSSRLAGKRILYLVTGSVAIFKVPEMIREAIRDGADVFVMLSPSAVDLMDHMIFEWATGNPVVTSITGNVEHVLYAGKHSQKVEHSLKRAKNRRHSGKIDLRFFHFHLDLLDQCIEVTILFFDHNPSSGIAPNLCNAGILVFQFVEHGRLMSGHRQKLSASRHEILLPEGLPDRSGQIDGIAWFGEETVDLSLVDGPNRSFQTCLAR